MTAHHALGFLNGLKSAELQRLARLTGSSTAGTKAELQARLHASLLTSRLQRLDEVQKVSRQGTHGTDDGASTTHRILSIDMGIRNLAYCTLSLVPAELNASSRAAASGGPSGGPQPIVRVHEWKRLALSSFSLPGSEVTLPNDNELPTSTCSPPQSLSTKETFSPPVLAPQALSILRALVLNPLATDSQPHSILIERQRWRSGGGVAVQEWTLRVNSLEAMLWAGLEVLHGLGAWKGTAHAVDPGAVGRFWVPEGLEKGRRGKETKVGLVKGWIEREAMHEADAHVIGDQGLTHLTEKLVWEGQAREMAEAFVAEKKVTRKGVKKVLKAAKPSVEGDDGDAEDAALGGIGGDALTKKDDLADCLCQGMAWIEWEKNRRAILANV